MRRGGALLLVAALLAACDPVTPKATGPSADSALALMFQNKYAAATSQLQDLIRAHPQDAKDHAVYALVLNYETKQKPALAEALKAQTLAPHDGFVLTVLTRVEDWNDDIQAAARDGAAAVKAAPNSALAHAFYGEALADTGQYAIAQAELTKSAGLAKKGTDYDRAEVERNWANYYRDKKDYVQSLAHLKLAAGAQPTWVERLLELARFSIARQDLPGATQFLQRAAGLSPDDAGLREQLGEVALFAQDYDVAKSAYQAALQLQPRSGLDLKLLGDIAVALNHDPTTAAKDERAAIAAQPTDQEAGAYLVAVLRYLNKNEAGAVQAAKQTVAPGASPASAATYVDLDQAAVDRQALALATVNAYRRLAGLAPVTSSAVIHQSALAHAFYTFFNGALASIRDLGIHKEESTGQGYTGDNVLTRAQHFGYPQRSMAEVITHRADPANAVTDWIDSVFHRIPLLRADLLELGYGDAYLGPMTVQVMDTSYRETATGRVILYPAPNQVSVPTAFNGNEIPDPAPNASYPIGYPVTATFDRNAKVTISAFHFRDPSGTDLAGVTLQPNNPETENSFAYLANVPLTPGTTYTADLTYTINGVAGHRTWHFTTAAGPSPTPPTQTAPDELRSRTS
ncbi:MAG TPA: CAP domain-containing protein [Candidatus Dormibacteraeota bacterium]|nr:CAP domain-containing protein [Candidatus Dormibacteraeota bacterium]